jgi:erythromycin esterase-like protein
MNAVLDYLRVVDPPAARRAQQRYACFDHFGGDFSAYGYAASVGLTPSCETAVVEQLLELRRSAAEYAQRDGRIEPDDLFYAEQNARLVHNAERYYRAMFGSRSLSWNLRDHHMVETLEALLAFHAGRGRREKVVVWAHNSHLGDARATELGRMGELNVGQLVRERFGRAVVNVGFLTYEGTVTAASDWDAPVERKTVRPALAGSYEALLHDAGAANLFLDLRAPGQLAQALDEPRLERAIGVIYRPDTERVSHYFQARLPRQFDAVLYYDRTRAVEPLERTGQWERGEVPETYPSAL